MIPDGLRFAMVTTFYPPESFGGDGILVRRIARALAARGHRVTVIHSSDGFRSLGGAPAAGEALGDGSPPGPEAGAPSRAEREPGGPATADALIERHDVTARPAWISPLIAQQTGAPGPLAGRLQRLLAGGSFDVVHFHNISLLGPRVLTYPAGGAARAWTLHDHWAVCPMHVLWRHNREPCDRRECTRCALAFRRPPQLWRRTSLLPDCARHVDLRLALSRFSAAKHREMGFPGPLEVLEPFVGDGETGLAAGQPPPHPRPYFLYVGRLERVKGADALLRARREFGCRTDVLIAGEGTEARRLRELARGLEGVRFLGRVPAAELDALYRHALAIVVPSAGFETFGMVVIEAFARGTPVIVRDIGPLPEIAAGGRGLVFRTEAELADAMERLACAPGLRAELGARAREAFLARWTEDRFVQRYQELLQPLLTRRGGARAAHARLAAARGR